MAYGSYSPSHLGIIKLHCYITKTNLKGAMSLLYNDHFLLLLIIIIIYNNNNNNNNNRDQKVEEEQILLKCYNLIISILVNKQSPISITAILSTNKVLLQLVVVLF